MDVVKAGTKNRHKMDFVKNLNNKYPVPQTFLRKLNITVAKHKFLHIKIFKNKFSPTFQYSYQGFYPYDAMKTEHFGCVYIKKNLHMYQNNVS